MTGKEIRRIKTISEFHKLKGFPPPQHPLISIVEYDLECGARTSIFNSVFDFYIISVRRMENGKFIYGQQDYDFDNGVMYFVSPNQVFGIEPEKNQLMKESGWMLLIHPDFFWNTPLARTIKQYEYFDYSVNEALFLSEKEELTLKGIIENIQQEYNANIDKFSQSIISSHLEALLNYSERFYQRQFITRKITHHQILDRLENLLSDYFNDANLPKKGLPTVQYISDQLNISPTYLRGLLKSLTGLNTQQHIHEKLISKAKEKLSTTNLSVSEIAYELGFEHPQSFSKLFKTKTNLAPLEFRMSFN